MVNDANAGFVLIFVTVASDFSAFLGHMAGDGISPAKID